MFLTASKSTVLGHKLFKNTVSKLSTIQENQNITVDPYEFRKFEKCKFIPVHVIKPSCAKLLETKYPA